MALRDRAPRAGQMHRTGEVMAHVLFPAPCGLDRRARHSGRDLDRLHHVVMIEPAPETATGGQDMQRDLRRIEAGDLRRSVPDNMGHLGGGPDRHVLRRNEHRRTQRLQRGMGETGRAVLRYDDLACLQHALNVSLIAQAAVAVFIPVRIFQHLPHLGAAGGIIWGPPIDLQGLGGFERKPCVLGNHGKAFVHLDDRPDPAHRKGGLGVIARHGPAAPGIGPHRGVQHPRQDHVDTVVLRSGGFGDDVEPLIGLAKAA